jgi:hypothetical protein
MEYFIVTVIAFMIGWKISELFHVISFKNILKDLGVSEQELRRLHTKMALEHGVEDLPDSHAAAAREGKTVVEIKIEQLQGQLFAYDLTQDTFIAQGRDGDELLQRILDKYPTNVRVICDVAHGGEHLNDAVARLSEKQT